MFLRGINYCQKYSGTFLLGTVRPLDDPLRAQRAVKEGLSIDPNDSDLHLMMAYFLARHGNLAAAQNYITTNQGLMLPEQIVAIKQFFTGKSLDESGIKELMHF